MQRPPATSLQVVRSSRARRILISLLLTFAGVPLYGWHAGMPMAHVLILAILWFIAAAWLKHYWHSMPQGRLRWDGESWHWSGTTEPFRELAIQYDFQTSLWLVMVFASGRKFGVWMDADPQNMSQWRAMRRALVGAGSSRHESDDPLDIGKQALR